MRGITLAIAGLLSMATQVRGQEGGTVPVPVPVPVAVPVPAAPAAAVIADVLERWELAFRDGRLQAGRPVARHGVDAEVYGELVAPAGYLNACVGRRSNVAALRDLLDLARRTGDVRAARAVLGIAAASHARRLTDPEALEIRELGHWTLMRAASAPEVRDLLFRAAAGDPGIVGQEAPAEDGEPEQDRAVLQRLAALKALGLSRDDRTRELIEAQLTDDDARVRLAAAEAIGRMRDADSIDLLVRAARTETHPVVAQALVVALDRTLTVHRDDPPASERGRMVRTVLQRLGTAGWRTDLELVELAEHNPDLESIPALIRVLDGWGSDDPLLEAINANASPILRQRAWRALRRLTGTIRPIDDPGAWWAFWEQERDHIVLPEDPVRSDAMVKTTTGFFGIPATGREIAFVIDVSGSMQEATTVQDERGRERKVSRLDLATRELTRAVQAMPRESRYHLITFSDEPLIWNERPVPPTEASHRALTECVGRWEAGGGTNLFGGLMRVLQPGGGAAPVTGSFDCDEVFVLTDGQPTAGIVKDPDAILRIVEELNRYRRTRIHSVHLGGEAGQDLMRRLAKQNEGIFVAY